MMKFITFYFIHIAIKCNSFYITYPSWIPEDNIYKNDSVIYCFKC